MKVIGRPPKYSEAQFLEVWHLWGDGNKLWDVAQMLNVNPGSIYGILKKYGGIAPYRGKHRDGHLTMQERERISRGLAANQSFAVIARGLERPTSTISREVHRNGGRDTYRTVAANERAEQQRKRPKCCRLDVNDTLRDHVIKKLLLGWSPEQIAGELTVRYPMIKPCESHTRRFTERLAFRLDGFIKPSGNIRDPACSR